MTAARYADRKGGALGRPAEHLIEASLVVDCTGRASRLPQWLKDWGFAVPREEKVVIGMCYTTAYFKRTGACAMGPGLEKLAVFGAVTNAQPRPGVLIVQEPGADGVPRWVMCVGGLPATMRTPRCRRCASMPPTSAAPSW